MVRVKSFAILCGATMAFSGMAYAVPTIDGTLTPGEGYSTAPLAVQTVTSNTGSALPFDSDGSRSPSQNQLSNAYGFIDTTNNQLDLFLGGSIDLSNEYLSIAVDANPNTGVATLNPGVHSGTNDTGNVSSAVGHGNGYQNIVFDAGFRPETLLTFQFDGGNIVYDDNLLTGTQYVENNFRSNPANGPTTIGPAAGDTAGSLTATIADNRALSGTLETAATSATATTGFEIGISLADLGYVAGSPINVSAFITQGSGTSMTDQVLASNPGADPTLDPYEQYNFDFTAAQGPGGHNAPGNQYFTVNPPAATPEPASLSLLALGGLALVRRTGRKA